MYMIHKSQMPIVLRYCYQKHIYEDFMGFVRSYPNFDEDTMEPKLTDRWQQSNSQKRQKQHIEAHILRGTV
ncbi:unnamed protein product [Acanthoscelides obtectus]|uniref:Uncharacterized protein n=1 Tax=Acanthoscelides obtectus TaxID=200917 RepID=A0A9P0MJ50_ACAOB|nr:unnamed protein product [Acanthoscelides obtectus]CAK1649293.1 hypothetical protein AOBTE_LOCUS16134 [Acanthoscelides obtectus]